MNFNIGKPAPNFTLYNSEKESISLSDYKGQNVLLLFFPLAFTSVCTKELCNVRDNLSMYNEFDTNVIGISVDSLQCLARFKKDQQLNFTLLSDFNKQASKSYGALYETFSYNMNGVSKRAAFLVDRNGLIQYAEVLENAAEMPNFEKINEALKSLK